MYFQIFYSYILNITELFPEVLRNEHKKLYTLLQMVNLQSSKSLIYMNILGGGGVYPNEEHKK